MTRKIVKKWNPQDLKDIREKHKLTQEGMADILGVSRIHINFIEAGKRKPGKVLRSLVEFLKNGGDIEGVRKITGSIKKGA